MAKAKQPAAPKGGEKIIRVDPSTLERGKSPNPKRSLVANVARRGVLIPILIAEKPKGGGYKVIAGLRRCLAVEEARGQIKKRLAAIENRKTEKAEATRKLLVASYSLLETIPAQVVADDRSLTLVENSNRSKNPLHEFEIIELMLKDAVTEEMSEAVVMREISRSTGMTVGTIKARLRLRDLSPDLLLALGEGRINVSVAEKAAKLPAKTQTRLEKILRNAGKLTTRDLSEVRTVGLTEAEKQLNFEDLGAVPIPISEFTSHLPEAGQEASREAAG